MSSGKLEVRGGHTGQLKVGVLLRLDKVQQDICETRLALGLRQTRRLAVMAAGEGRRQEGVVRAAARGGGMC